MRAVGIEDVDRVAQFGLAVVEALVVVEVVLAVARLIGGDRPVETATFVGYLVTALVLLPVAGILASEFERTVRVRRRAWRMALSRRASPSGSSFIRSSVTPIFRATRG